MIVVFAIDALEYELVEEFDCKHLKQAYYGKTDISEFSEPRTIVLWSSFMTGQNKEKEILAKGDKEMWNTKIDLNETFFSKFANSKIIDLPGYNYNKKVHDKSRLLLKKFFDSEREKKEKVKNTYNEDAFAHHKEIKKEFLKVLDANYNFVLGYFSIADVIGHLNFGNKKIIKLIYEELNDIAKQIKEKTNGILLVISDHGMKGGGKFGYHSEYGFWSLNRNINLKKPKITDFAEVILSLK